MSRILIKIKNHKKLICLLSALLTVSICGTVIRNYYLTGVTLATALGFIINFLSVRKMRSGTAVFSARSKIRNIDTLIIGEPCSLEGVAKKDSYLQIAAPGRSLGAAYEILRHTFGIMKEDNGEAVLVVKKGNTGNDFGIFDIPYFQLSPVSIKRLNLEVLQKKAKIPLVFAPIRTVQMLLSLGKNRIPREVDVPHEIYDFCKERNIRIRCMTVD